MFMPGDVDLKANMEYAQSSVEQAVSQRAPVFIRVFDKATETLSPDNLVVVSAVSYSLIFLLAVMWLFVKDIRRYLRLLIFVCCVVFILSAAGLYLRIDRINQPWLVVLDKEIEAKYEPFDTATTYFRLFEGQEVLLAKAKGEWAFIKRPDGKLGWVRASGIEKI
jgi:hypothetical protein